MAALSGPERTLLTRAYDAWHATEQGRAVDAAVPANSTADQRAEFLRDRFIAEFLGSTDSTLAEALHPGVRTLLRRTGDELDEVKKTISDHAKPGFFSSNWMSLVGGGIGMAVSWLFGADSMIGKILSFLLPVAGVIIGGIFNPDSLVSRGLDLIGAGDLRRRVVGESTPARLPNLEAIGIRSLEGHHNVRDVVPGDRAPEGATSIVTITNDSIGHGRTIQLIGRISTGAHTLFHHTHIRVTDASGGLFDIPIPADAPLGLYRFAPAGTPPTPQIVIDQADSEALATFVNTAMARRDAIQTALADPSKPVTLEAAGTPPVTNSRLTLLPDGPAGEHGFMSNMGTITVVAGQRIAVPGAAAGTFLPVGTYTVIARGHRANADGTETANFQTMELFNSSGAPVGVPTSIGTDGGHWNLPVEPSGNTVISNDHNRWMSAGGMPNTGGGANWSIFRILGVASIGGTSDIQGLVNNLHLPSDRLVVADVIERSENNGFNATNTPSVRPTGSGGIGTGTNLVS